VGCLADRAVPFTGEDLSAAPRISATAAKATMCAANGMVEPFFRLLRIALTRSQPFPPIRAIE
jgi:hypothetical protein